VARVLVIDDDGESRQILEEQLRLAGHVVQTARNASEGIRMARERRPNIVLLDAALPDMTPAGVCRALEGAMATRGLFVIAMLAKDQKEVVSGAGVDGVIAKPFSMQEILSHIESAVRRARPSVDVTKPIEFGILRVERDAQLVWVAEQEVKLTTLEYKLLVTLHDRRGLVQTRETLLSDIWGLSGDLATRTVDTHVKKLRKKLGHADRYVQTVRGIGYRFAESPDEHE
jgi:two-component system phosphate regulon response regulator PhoB